MNTTEGDCSCQSGSKSDDAEFYNEIFRELESLRLENKKLKKDIQTRDRMMDDMTGKIVQLKGDLEEAVARLRLGGYDGDFISRFPVEEKRPDETWVDDNGQDKKEPKPCLNTN